MSFEVDRSSWAHIALCADLTWATEPPDEFIIANQRLWAQHCRISQALQESTDSQPSQCELTDNKCTPPSQSQENGNHSGRRSVKDVIPESRLAQFYGNFYYDEVREKCYSSTNERINFRGYNGQGCENTDLTECWMLPEVEYWFRKLLDDPCDRSMCPRRRRQYRMLPDEDLSARRQAGWCFILQVSLVGHYTHERMQDAFRFVRKYGRLDLFITFTTNPKWIEITQKLFEGQTTHDRHDIVASERWGPNGARGEEATLAARVCSVRGLWANPPSHRTSPRAPSPPPQPRKIRARRRQPRRLTALAPPPPAYCLEIPAQLLCDPTCKFQFDAPRPPQLTECQRAMGRLTASVQAAIRASTARCPPYRGTNVSRYAPTGQRPARCQDRRYIWWPRDHLSPRLDRFQLTQNVVLKTKAQSEEQKQTPPDNNETPKETSESEPQASSSPQPDKLDSPKENVVDDGQQPSTSAAAMDQGLRTKRLYSTVLSMSAPSPTGLSPVGCVRLAQKLVTPGILKLNPKIVLPGARIRPPNVDHKFEELEKEALEQYKASDESIDTKFQELEKQAEEQYSNSNSNTSCSSGNSAEKKLSSSPSESDSKTKQSAKFHKEKPVDSVVIYSQNFPDLNTKQTSSVMNLKNFHGPPRGEKKDSHRTNKSRLKGDSQRAASDTDYEARDTNVKNHKGPMRWSLHVVPPKKRHLTVCVSDFSSDEELEESSGSIKDAGPRAKNHAGKMKMSAHGGGDLHPIMRKT